MGNIKPKLSGNTENGTSIGKIAIIAVADNVDPLIVKRFLWGIDSSRSGFPVDVILGRHRNPEKTFSKTTILNDIIRENIKKYEVIVQTDIDMFIPPNLIRATYSHCSRVPGCFHSTFRYAEPKEVDGKKYKNLPWKSFSSRTVNYASGSWNGLRNFLWNEFGGFCEAITRLGGPDSEFYLRSKKNGMHWYISNQYPLLHINHPRRAITKQGKKNLSEARKFPADTNWLRKRNKEIGPTKSNIYRYGT